MALNVQDLMGLQKLLGTEEEADDCLPPSVIPGKRSAMGYQSKSQVAPKMQVTVAKKKVEKKAEPVWKEDDFKAGAGLAIKDEDDGRKVPEYDIVFKQDVGAEDVFLNLGQVDGSTDHCKSMILKIKLPNTKLSEITLDVQETRVVCSAPKYKLNCALPHPVLKDEGNAKWDKIKGVLSVTLPIKIKVQYFQDVADLVKEEGYGG